MGKGAAQIRSSSSILEQPEPKNPVEWWCRFWSAEAAWTFAFVFTNLLFWTLTRQHILLLY